MSDITPEPAGPNRGRRRATAVAVVGSLAALSALAVTRWTDDTPRPPTVQRPSTATTAPEPGTGADIVDDAPSSVTVDQLDGLRFTDITAQAGLDVPHSDTELEADFAMTSGAAVADVDRDGDTDLYLTRIGRPGSLYLNDGKARFTDITERAGVPGPAEGAGAVTFGDVDADGCLDLLLLGAGTGPVMLYMSNCDGTFRDEADGRGAALPPSDAQFGAQGHGATFADPDHDGDLDLLLLHWDAGILTGKVAEQARVETPTPDSVCDTANAIRRLAPNGVADRGPTSGANRSRFLRNDGTGRFTDATAEFGLPLDQIVAFTGDFVDVDDDGWEDLLIAGDFCTSRLFRNDGGRRFVDVTETAGVGTDENGMGSVVRDINGDGRPDWFVTGISLPTRSGQCPQRVANLGCSGNRMYLNRGDGTFDDRTDDLGVRHGWWGWGAAIEDFGNDGRLSVAMTNGYSGNQEVFETDPLRFWIPEGERFIEAAGPAGLDSTARGHAMVPFDADGDGGLDLLVANFGDPPVLYRNDRPADRNWLTVRLDDPTRRGNAQALGAKVRVTPTRGAPVTGWISTSGSYESQRLAELHVGLGTRGSVRRVEVWWPGSDEPQTVATPELNQVLVVTRRTA